MPKKAVDKKPKKTVKKVAPVKVEESTIDALPSPSAEAPVSLETTQPVSPTTPVTPLVTPEVVTPPTPNTPSPESPTDVPTVAVEPNQPAIAPIDNTVPNATLPTVTPIGDTTTLQTDESDDFEPEHKGNGMKVVLIFLTAIIVGGGAVAGFLFFSQNKQASVPQVTVSPTQAISPTEPVASESAAMADIANLSVQILNGSGTAGEAARVRDFLQEAGFETFSLGNADSYEYTDTEVQLKEASPSAVFGKIKDALSTYTVVEKDQLPATSDYDVVIFVGKHK